ncbi:UNVERIFIED_CONTAM: hypothetical protein K2H54_008251 [Gekko kuhli]
MTPGPSCKGRNDTLVFRVAPPVQSNGKDTIGLLIINGIVVTRAPRPGIIKGVLGPIGVPVVVAGVTGAVVTGAGAGRVGAVVSSYASREGYTEDRGPGQNGTQHTRSVACEWELSALYAMLAQLEESKSEVDVQPVKLWLTSQQGMGYGGEGKHEGA